MAPALVELSTSKERNSSSKKYMNNISCMSHLNIELVDKIRFADSSPLFTCDIEQVKEGEHNCKIKKFSCQGMVSDESDKSPISNLNGKVLNPLKNENKFYCNVKKTNGETTDLKIEIKEEPECCNHKSTTTTLDEREPQPFAEYKPSNRIYQILNKKETSVQKNYSQIHSKLINLNNRINNLSSKNFTAHVASFINKSDILEHQSKNEESNRGIIDNTILVGTNQLPLKHAFDLCSLTDDEEELQYKQKISFQTKKTKNLRPPPPVGILHQWKKSRAKVGSQCTWLTLKMAALDEKISSLNQLHTTLKTSRTVRNHNYEECAKKQQSSLHNTNGISTNDVGHLAQQHQDVYHGCSRTRPFISTQYHKYIKRTTSNNDSINPEHKYGCRCIDGNVNCRLCAKRIKIDHKAQSRTELCDQNYHPVLSQKQDISLAFLLEETLRRQRINTKVTVTKTKKKKKRPQSLETSSPGEIKGERPMSIKGKSKHDRSKSDEYSRKRYASSDISSKLKKFRKLSESCDSASKPSTPTNELSSPLSQSMPSGGLSGMKRKKGASADYDINNIVIPYSIASSTRVERIQYKEIPTPGWRTANDNLDNDEADLDRELTDDDTYLERHSHCEIMEQRRFTDYFQPVRRQRSSRVSEGPNSEPPSPHMIDERPLVNTPLESPNPLKLLQNRLANLVVCTEDERDLSWIPRKFPLSEVESAKLDIFSAPSSPCFVTGELKRIPKPASLSRSSSYTHLSNITPRHSPVPPPSPLASPPPTPDGSSWTVKVVNDVTVDSQETSTVSPLTLAGDKHRKGGIVLKLAKK